ncbi:phosphotransferase family protein [Nocardia aurea]|uniref:phosphotransferase family protein n=1 Tax=Nocardia aurea TaxID=2144174 RepID=UPI000D694D90|nr:phosphotransferase family protein [Nocardia aurea]
MWRSHDDTTQQDWARLSAWARDNGHRIDVTDVRQFAGGIANLNYLIDFDGVPAVLRRPPAGVLAESASDMAREWRVLSGLHRSFALAPRGLLYCADPAVLGAPFQILEYRPGIAITATLPDTADSGAPDRLTATLIDAMVGLHTLDPDDVGLGELGRPDGFLARQLHGWTRRATAVWPQGLPSTARQLIDVLDREIPDPAGVSLLHMDFKLNNILVDPDTLRANAVIDWDMATRGCPLFDLAVLLSYWVETADPEPLHRLNEVPSLTVGFGDRSAIAQRYFHARGVPPRSLVWHVACARLRLAVAWMQLYRKWQAGEVTGTRYAEFADIADTVLDWAIHQFTKGAV